MPYADRAGVRLYWEEEGSGDPLLLVMGLGYPLQMWHRTRQIVSRHFRTILFDNRGAGRSDKPPGPYSISDMANDAMAILDSAQVESAHVFGVSMGGLIAQEIALQSPERVRSLVLGCTGCGGPRAVRAEREAFNVLLARDVTMPEHISASVPYLYHPETPPARIEEDLAIRREHIPEPSAYQAQLAAILSWQSYERLPGIRVPVLVIHGGADRLVPPGNGALIAERIPNAQLVLLPGAGHLFTTDQPEAAHTAILDFLTNWVRSEKSELPRRGFQRKLPPK